MNTKYVEIAFSKAQPEASAVWKALARIASVVIPKANPDFEAVYPQVHHWWLEVAPTGEVLREVGFDEGGRPIVWAPWKRNLGVFTDEETGPERWDSEIGKEQFEATWALVTRT